ncbi:LexA family protein [Litoribacillus peritrichatus]|uniref:Peptidase S24/S26A/S26B/S26C domain-containing protein n=1 Tax=Litoribacillus peritrichatus TaxID=718191 RepID=A0ABP7N9U1_9GAMM
MCTYFVRASDDSIVRSEIVKGNIQIVDRPVTPKPRDIVVAAVDGWLIYKYFDLENKTPSHSHQELSADSNY